MDARRELDELWDEDIEQRLDVSTEPPEPEKSKFDSLKKSINGQNHSIFLVIKEIISAELEVMFEASEYSHEVIKIALQKMVDGNLDVIDNERLEKDLTTLKDFLTLKKHSENYAKLIRKCDKKNLPQLSKIRLATFLYIIEIAADHELEIMIDEVTAIRLIENEDFVFLPFKQYCFEELIDLYNNAIKPYSIDCWHVDVIEHFLLRYADITEFSFYCENRPDFIETAFGHHVRTFITPGIFYINLGLTQASIAKFIRFYQNALGMDMCEKHSPMRTHVFTVRMNINAMVRLFQQPAFKNQLTEFLHNEVLIKNYQLIQNNKIITSNEIIKIYENIAKTYRLNCKSDFFEMSLALAFGVRETFLGAQFQGARRYEAFATETDFFLGLPEQDVKNLVTVINIWFPKAARFICANTRHDQKPKLVMQHISIQNSVLIQKEFQTYIEKGLRLLVDEYPHMYELFLVESGTIKHTRKQLSEKIESIADDLQDDDRLGKSLKTFSLFQREKRSQPDIELAKFEVNKAIAAHQGSMQTQEQYNLFKQGKKRQIKSLFIEVEEIDNVLKKS